MHPNYPPSQHPGYPYSRHPSYGSLDPTPRASPVPASQGQGEYQTAYEMAMVNAVTGGLRGNVGESGKLLSKIVREDERVIDSSLIPFCLIRADLNGIIAYSNSLLDPFHRPFHSLSRPTTPHILGHPQQHPHSHPSSALHTAQTTPNLSPRESSSPSASQVGPTRKTKYTRSRTGCLGCRVKRVKCDEGRPSCKRCINAKREVS
jgi:hypothetical protein